MKFILSLTLLVFSITYSFAQDTTFTVYNIQADAISDLNSAINRANSENKHVLVQVGGNWCKWCRMFYKWSHSNKTIDSLLKADYIVVHANFSKENKNPALMKRLEYPQRFGFPVFLVLDGSGNRLHTQNTGYLEDGQGYSEEKVSGFLNQWNRNAMKDENYIDK